MLRKFRFIFSDGLVKLSLSVLLILLFICLASIVSLGLDVEVWPYLPRPSANMSLIYLNLSYSYVVAYVFFLLTIVLPRILELCRWYWLFMTRFNKFYEAWAKVYMLYHFGFKIGNRKAIEDPMVRLQADASQADLAYKANRHELGLNLADFCSQLDVFSNLFFNQSQKLPSSLDVVLQELSSNPVKAEMPIIIEILRDATFNEENAIMYAEKAVRDFDLIFHNLLFVAKKTGLWSILRKYDKPNDLYKLNAQLVRWLK